MEGHSQDKRGYLQYNEKGTIFNNDINYNIINFGDVVIKVISDFPAFISIVILIVINSSILFDIVKDADKIHHGCILFNPFLVGILVVIFTLMTLVLILYFFKYISLKKDLENRIKKSKSKKDFTSITYLTDVIRYLEGCLYSWGYIIFSLVLFVLVSWIFYNLFSFSMFMSLEPKIFLMRHAIHFISYLSLSFILICFPIWLTLCFKCWCKTNILYPPNKDSDIDNGKTVSVPDVNKKKIDRLKKYIRVLFIYPPNYF